MHCVQAEHSIYSFSNIFIEFVSFFCSLSSSSFLNRKSIRLSSILLYFIVFYSLYILFFCMLFILCYLFFLLPFVSHSLLCLCILLFQSLFASFLYNICVSLISPYSLSTLYLLYFCFASFFSLLFFDRIFKGGIFWIFSFKGTWQRGEFSGVFAEIGPA
jgi:hypothetical protein